MLRMRFLIKNEFGELLSFQSQDAATKFCEYGSRSKQPTLRELAQQLASLIANPVPETARPQESGILELLASNLIDQPVRLVFARIPAFVIDKPRRRCLLNFSFEELLEDLRPLGTVDPGLSQLEPIPLGELAELEKKAISTSLYGLMWFCGLQFSQGQLLPTPRSFPAFGLGRWPDFGTLPHTAQHLKMATFLMRKTASLDGLAAGTGVARDEAIAFLNACFLCGWLKRVEATALPASAAPKSGLRGVIGRIRVRLGMGG
ncbi:MAG: hypothetical protein P9G45_02200 [Candidatus Contendobacter sp.]|nr:hypothetical protein [Candidatus Contendobacter sp.]